MRTWDRYVTIAAAAIFAASLTSHAQASAIAPGDILVYQTRNDVTGPSNAAPVNILEINPVSHTLVQTFLISNQSSPLYSTTVDPIANIALSNNGSEISFPGWTTKGTIGTPLGTTPGIPRGVGTLFSNGAYTQPSTYNPATLSTPDQPHAAYSPDGINWYFGDTSGMYYNNSTTPLTNSDATLSIKGFGSSTYALHTLSSSFLPPIGSDAGPASLGTALSKVTPATAAPGITSITYTPVVTLPAGAHDFVFVSSFNQSPDLLYVTTSTGISKFASPGGFANGPWTPQGSIALTGATGITAKFVSGVGVELFVTVDNGPPAGVVATLDEFIDTSLVSANLTAASPTILFTAGTLNSLQGVSLAPTPEPTSLSLLALSIPILLRRKQLK